MEEKLAVETWQPLLLENGIPIELDKVKGSVLGLDLNSLQLSLIDGIKISREKVPEEWFEIDLAYRWKQILPKNCKVLVINNNELKLVNVEDICKVKEDIWVATPSRLFTNEREPTQNELDLLSYISYFIGDGYQRRGNEVVLTINDVGVFDRISDLCKMSLIILFHMKTFGSRKRDF